MLTKITKGNVKVIETKYSNIELNPVHSIRNNKELTEFKNQF